MKTKVKFGLTPDYVLGFTDGEGSFTGDRFVVTNTDKHVIELFLEYFKVGKLCIHERKAPRKTCYRFEVRNVEGLKKIIKFFDEHPPIVKAKQYKEWRARNINRRKRIPRFSENTLENVKNLYLKGLTSKEIADELKLKKHQVEHIEWRLRLLKRANYWKQEDKQKVCNLYQQGHTMREIAKIFGRTVASINHIIQRSTTFRKRAKVLKP